MTRGVLGPEGDRCLLWLFVSGAASLLCLSVYLCVCVCLSLRLPVSISVGTQRLVLDVEKSASEDECVYRPRSCRKGMGEGWSLSL